MVHYVDSSGGDIPLWQDAMNVACKGGDFVPKDPVINPGHCNGPLARYVKLRVAHAPGMSRTFSPLPRVSDPDMHHGTCATHRPWCIPGSLTSSFLLSWWLENVPGITGSCATRYFTYLSKGPWLQVSSLLSPPRWFNFFIYYSWHAAVTDLLAVMRRTGFK